MTQNLQDIKLESFFLSTLNQFLIQGKNRSRMDREIKQDDSHPKDDKTRGNELKHLSFYLKVGTSTRLARKPEVSSGSSV